MSRVRPAPSPLTPKNTINTIARQIIAEIRSAHLMPKIEAATAEALPCLCKAANVSIRITNTGAPTAPAI